MALVGHALQRPTGLREGTSDERVEHRRGRFRVEAWPNTKSKIAHRGEGIGQQPADRGLRPNLKAMSLDKGVRGSECRRIGVSGAAGQRVLGNPKGLVEGPSGIIHGFENPPTIRQPQASELGKRAEEAQAPEVGLIILRRVHPSGLVRSPRGRSPHLPVQPPWET